MGKKKTSSSGKRDLQSNRKPLSREQGNRLAGKVETIATGLCDDEHIELVHVEFVSDKYSNILRVYIDKPEGVTMADCSNISRQLGDILDVSLDINTEYRLEVSSPGIYRQLYKKKDYTRFSGKTVAVKLNSAIDGKKKLTGTLKGITDDDCVTLQINDAIIKIDYSSINSARLSDDNGEDRC